MPLTKANEWTQMSLILLAFTSDLVFMTFAFLLGALVALLFGGAVGGTMRSRVECFLVSHDG